MENYKMYRQLSKALVHGKNIIAYAEERWGFLPIYEEGKAKNTIEHHFMMQRLCNLHYVPGSD
jgi:hypothetical protein